MRPRTSRRAPDYPGFTWRLSWDSPKFLVAYPFRFLCNTVLFDILPFVTAKYWRTSTSRPRTGENRVEDAASIDGTLWGFWGEKCVTRCGGSFCYSSPQGTEAGGLAGDLLQVQAQPGLHSKFQPKQQSKTLSKKQTNRQNKNPRKTAMVTQPPQANVEQLPRHIKKKNCIKNVLLCVC